MSYVFINALHINELLSRILAAAGSVDYLFFSCMAYFFIERYGRRKIFMSSAAACCTCWVIIAISLAISDTGRGDQYKLGVVAVSFFFVFFASFGSGGFGCAVVRNSLVFSEIC
jgi:Sugar (and other) transporter.